ncbi:MAG: carboxypeptidase-like regulatory domain-containing protein, partial [Muribaculaceae bacterium]|nr:carboxypeptidase-like regulatory domain-containing protein [Muribaculaceae bacterium]
MRTTKLINRIGLVALLGILSLFASGCSDKEGAMGDEVVGQGTLNGVVTDDLNQPLSGVTVTDLSSAKSTSTSTDGSFTLSDIALHSEGQIVTFEKTGYETTSITLVPAKFAKGIATANVEMTFANAIIKGYLTDARNNNQPLAGAEVSVSTTNKAVSDAQGYYEIAGLALRDYT